MSQKDSKLKRAVTFFKHMGIPDSTTKRRAKSRANSMLVTSSQMLKHGLPNLFDQRRRKRRSQYIPTDPEYVETATRTSLDSDTPLQFLNDLDNVAVDDWRKTLYTFYDGEFLLKSGRDVLTYVQTMYQNLLQTLINHTLTL